MENLTKDRGPLCPFCNMVQIKLVPLYDNDQEHKRQMCCVSCKRKIRAGIPIEKIDRSKLQAGN